MGDMLSLYAAAQPTKSALIEDRPGAEVRTLDFAAAEAAANRLAHALAGFGVGNGVPLAWCGPNSIGVALLIHAARKLGATAVPVNYRFSDSEAAYVIDHCDASVLYVDAEQAPMIARIRDEIPKVTTVLVYGGPPPTGPGAEGFLDAEALAAAQADTPPPAAAAGGSTIIYTSGTTGKPKGALRPLALDPAYIGAIIGIIGYTSDDVYLTTGPLYHSGPSAFMNIGFALGQTVVIQRKFEPLDWLRLVETHRVTTTFSAPTPVRMVCNLPEPGTSAFDVSSIRRLIANAAPWSFALKQQYLARFPADSLFEVYGSTELGINCILEPADQLRKPGACGQPVPGLEVRLYDDQDEVVTGVGADR